MTNKIFIPVYLLVILIAACTGKTKEGFHLNGKMANLKAGTKVYLDEESLSAANTIDSVTAGTDGVFDMHGFIKEESLCRLRFGNDKAMLLIMDEKPSDIYLEANVNEKLIKPSVIKGSVKTAELYSLIQYSMDNGKEMQKLQASTDSSSTLTDSAKQVIYSKLKEMNVGAHNYIMTFCDTVQSPVLSIFAANAFLQRQMTSLNMVVENLLKRYPQSSIVKEYAARLKGSDQDPYKPKQLFSDGQPLPDIVAEGTDGKERKLSSLKGQYVLVDFWASWCKPCRGENPNVVSMYNLYKNKGFNVFSVSLDEDKNKWQQAIQQDNLTWNNHVSELKGWKSSFCTTFAITSIPTNYLIDKDGKVIGFNLRGDELQNKLATIFK